MHDAIDKNSENISEFTVTELSGQIKKLLQDSFGRIRVRGEIGRVFRAASGHLYYDLKDHNNVLACTTWKGQACELSVQPEEGLEVVAIGRLSAFGAQSRYNLNVDDLAVAGLGALMAQLEKRKAALAKEGLFDPARKKKIPYLPDVIAVVTSPQGAVIRDILHRLRDRFARPVMIWPTAVQGDKCPQEVAGAIAGLNALPKHGAITRPDVIIVARGGGSIEDLWGYNDEAVVRAVAASSIPIISAVGHETDTTLIDLVADLRAPTPSAAAEFAVPVRVELQGTLNQLEARRVQMMQRVLQNRKQRLRDLSRALPRPERVLAQHAQHLDMLGARLPRALGQLGNHKRAQFMQCAAGLRAQNLHHRMAQGRDKLQALSLRATQSVMRAMQNNANQLAHQERLLNGLSHHATLKRGYVVVRDDAGAVIMSKQRAKLAKALELEFSDGKLNTQADPQGRLL